MHNLDKAKHSINTDQLSQDAFAVFELLDGQQLKVIQKYYPFRATRNKAIVRLKRKGVKIQTLVKLTGLQRASILRITKGIKPEPAGSNHETSYETTVSDTLNEIVKIGKELSPSALEVWNSLSDDQQRNIQGRNPFKALRNTEIINLKQKGVEGPIIVEITGLSRTSVSRISRYFKPKWETKNPEMINGSDVIKRLNELVMHVKDLGKELSEIKTAILYKNEEK